MKKLFIVSIILLSLTLVWCSQNKLSQDELFEKKQECLLYKVEILENIEIQSKKHWWISYTHIEELEEIFYSPTKNSCMYTTKVTEITENDTCVFYKLYDYFGKDYSTANYMVMDLEWKKCDYTKTLNLYENKIKELKWE